MYLLLGKYFSLHLTEQETEDERSQVIKVYLFMLYAGPHRSVVKDSPVEHHSPVFPVEPLPQCLSESLETSHTARAER